MLYEVITNFGRVILNNILANGYDPASIRIIRPGLERFESIACVPDLDGLDTRLDLFVVAVGADHVITSYSIHYTKLYENENKLL